MENTKSCLSDACTLVFQIIHELLYYTLTEAFGAVAALKIDALAILAPLGGFGVGAGSPPVLKALWAARRPR